VIFLFKALEVFFVQDSLLIKPDVLWYRSAEG